MNFRGGHKLKLLYLLALFQLVAGPLVLWQVTVFSKIALHELPEQGITRSFGKAWHSEEFQAALDESPRSAENDRKSPLPADSKAKLPKMKMPIALWEGQPLPRMVWNGPMPRAERARIWTPVRPQAPPGPPPRVG